MTDIKAEIVFILIILIWSYIFFVVITPKIVVNAIRGDLETMIDTEINRQASELMYNAIKERL